MRGFITFEGTEGCGKSTQVRLAAEYLSSQRVDHITTREPGGTQLGEAVRRLLLDPAQPRIEPLGELLLIGAARVQHVEQVIHPALQEGKVVLCDRYEDSTRAYQGAGRGLPENVVTLVCSIIAAEVKPDLTFLFDVPPEEGLRRARGRNAGGSTESRLDEEEIAFHRRVRDGFLELAAAHPGRFRVLSGTEPPDRVARRVARDLALYLKLT